MVQLPTCDVDDGYVMHISVTSDLVTYLSEVLMKGLLCVEV